MALISSNVNGEKELNELWHRRMGHLHHGALRMLKETVTGVPMLTTKHDDTCKGYMLGKYAKAAYSRSNNKAKSVLGLIHSHICGPMSTRAISGAEYFFTFIDDHSRETWIYFLRAKDEVFDRFKEFKALVKNLTGRKIKILRSNNGGKYTDKNFTDFYAREGIRREWTTPYNPEHNGVAERKNKIIVGAAKAMLYDQNLPKFLWAEACNMIVYIQNRTPHRVLGKKTPEGVFTGKKAEVSHLKIFGSVAYCHIPEEKRSKLEQTVEVGYLVGYNETSKAY